MANYSAEWLVWCHLCCKQVFVYTVYDWVEVTWQTCNCTWSKSSLWSKSITFTPLLWQWFVKKGTKWSHPSHGLTLVCYYTEMKNGSHFVSNFCISWIIKCGAAVTQQSGIGNWCWEESHIKKWIGVLLLIKCSLGDGMKEWRWKWPIEIECATQSGEVHALD